MTLKQVAIGASILGFTLLFAAMSMLWAGIYTFFPGGNLMYETLGATAMMTVMSFSILPLGENRLTFVTGLKLALGLFILWYCILIVMMVLGRFLLEVFGMI